MIPNALNKLLFLDIETATIVEDFFQLSDRLGDIWMKRHQDDGSPSKSFSDLAGLQPEFSKVICVSIGYFLNEPEEKEQKFKVMSLIGEEADILKRLDTIMAKMKGYDICGHNVKNFDCPFLAKRYIINGLKIPAKLDNSGKKPWEISNVDTQELWKFGSFNAKHVSLDLLTAVLDIPSPKGGMDGSMVGKAFYEGRIEEISQYCMNDVVASARVAQRFNGLIPVSDENIVRA